VSAARGVERQEGEHGGRRSQGEDEGSAPLPVHEGKGDHQGERVQGQLEPKEDAEARSAPASARRPGALARHPWRNTSSETTSKSRALVCSQKTQW